MLHAAHIKNTYLHTYVPCMTCIILKFRSFVTSSDILEKDPWPHMFNNLNAKWNSNVS